MVELIEISTELAAGELGKEQIDSRVMEVMGRVPRHRFVPRELLVHAYANTPLPIGLGKTISQPFIVAAMTDLLDLRPDSAVLEVGTGLGYQSAILAELAGEVWSVEIVEELAGEAEARLHELGYRNVTIRIGDGARGWAEHAPFDRILVSAAARDVPKALIDQLLPGGRIVMPLGDTQMQWLSVIDKDDDGDCRVHRLMPVVFSELETV